MSDSDRRVSDRVPGPLIAVSELASLIARERPPVVFDVRWSLAGPPGIEGYRAGHIPGARFADLDRDLADPPGTGGRHPLPDPARFEAAMRAAGLDAGRPAVVYDAADATSAARLWWLLRYHGHDQVRVLDGGLAAWVAAGLPLESVIPAAAAGDFAAKPGQLPVLDAAGAAAVARSGVLFDVRAPERYRGEFEPVDPVAGHIPGAVSSPLTGNTGPDGRFRPAEELRARFAAAGLVTGAGAGAYCGSGVGATQQLLALELAGLPGTVLYPGSWSEWITDPARPVATGPEAG